MKITKLLAAAAAALVLGLALVGPALGDCADTDCYTAPPPPVSDGL